MPRILTIDPNQVSLADLQPIVDLLLNGGVVAGPTQTFYGLMAAANRHEALFRIQKVKGRDGQKPLLLLLDHPERVFCYAREVPASAAGLMKKFWPGPLTLLFQALPGLAEPLVGQAGTVGMRVEGLSVIRLLVRMLDRAVTGTSANPTGRPPARTAEQVLEYFGARIDLIMDCGLCPGGQPSTLIDVSTSPPRLVRPGVLSLDAIRRVVPDMRT